MCVDHLGSQIEEYVKENDTFGIKVILSYDDKLGTGGAIKKALPLLSHRFVVLYGDTYLEPCILNMVKTLRDSKLSDALMAVYHNKDKWDKSNIILSENKVIQYDKFNPTPDMEYIDYGMGFLCKNIFENQPESFDLADLYRKLVAEGNMAGYEAKERFYEIGSIEGLKETSEYLENK